MNFFCTPLQRPGSPAQSSVLTLLRKVIYAKKATPACPTSKPTKAPTTTSTEK